MHQITITDPREWKDLFIAHGGWVSIPIAGVGAALTVSQLDHGLSGAIGVAALFATGTIALIWYAARMATDAVTARESGREITATVTGVQHIQRQQNSWAGPLKGRLSWRDDNYTNGKSLAHRFGYVDQWQPGDQITVFCGKHATWWEGDVGKRTVVRSPVPNVGRS